MESNIREEIKRVYYNLIKPKGEIENRTFAQAIANYAPLDKGLDGVSFNIKLNNYGNIALRLINTFSVYNEESPDKAQHITNELTAVDAMLYDKPSSYNSQAISLYIKSSPKDFVGIRSMYDTIGIEKMGLTKSQLQIEFRALLLYKEFLKMLPKQISKNFKMRKGTEQIWQYINDYITSPGISWAEGSIFNGTVVWLETGKEMTLFYFLDRIFKYTKGDKNKNINEDSELVEFQKSDSDWRIAFAAEYFVIGSKQQPVNEKAYNDSRKRRHQPKWNTFRNNLTELIKQLNTKFKMDYQVSPDPTYNSTEI